MKKIIITGLMLMIASIIFLSGCGGDEQGKNTDDDKAATQPTRAVVKLSMAGATSQTLAAVQATLQMPIGVTVKATQNAPQTDSDVVTASGTTSGADLVMGVYSAASGTVTVYLTKAAGFGTGEFATINCDIAAGSSPKSSDFSVSDLFVWDTEWQSCYRPYHNIHGYLNARAA